MSPAGQAGRTHAAPAMTPPPILPRQAGEATGLRRLMGGEDTRDTCRKENGHDC